MPVDNAPIWCKLIQKKGGAILNARFSHSMPDDLNQKLEKIAEQKGMTKTALINMIVSDYAGYFEAPGFFAEIRKRLEKIEREVFKNKN